MVTQRHLESARSVSGIPLQHACPQTFQQCPAWLAYTRTGRKLQQKQQQRDGKSTWQKAEQGSPTERFGLEHPCKGVTPLALPNE
jgi:hypothetical protein